MNEEIENLLDREQFVLASIQKRALAFFIDEVLLSIIFIAIIWKYFVQATNIEQMIDLTNSFVLEYMALKIVYQTFFVALYGASIGKIVTKIKVIEIMTLEKPGIIVSFNRAVFRVISEMIFYLGFLWGVMNPSRQAWHDLTAKTLVIDA
ncbi:RDD family protein [Sulfurimonas sp. HSL-1716]|uniref:RDD family protein n=1 Tax=Hydrocurvibacter sulfurireducens TaxID=3131937 RepID=UPI0031F78EBD